MTYASTKINPSSVLTDACKAALAARRDRIVRAAYARSLRLIAAGVFSPMGWDVDITPENALAAVKYMENIRPNRDPATEARRKSKYNKTVLNMQPQVAQFA